MNRTTLPGLAAALAVIATRLLEHLGLRMDAELEGAITLLLAALVYGVAQMEPRKATPPVPGPDRTPGGGPVTDR